MLGSFETITSATEGSERAVVSKSGQNFRDHALGQRSTTIFLSV